MYRSPSGRYYYWDRIAADARRIPGIWFLALPAVPASTAKYVRDKRHRDLRLPRGRLEADARNTYTHEGHLMADLYVRYLEN